MTELFHFIFYSLNTFISIPEQKVAHLRILQVLLVYTKSIQLVYLYTYGLQYTCYTQPFKKIYFKSTTFCQGILFTKHLPVSTICLKFLLSFCVCVCVHVCVCGCVWGGPHPVLPSSFPACSPPVSSFPSSFLSWCHVKFHSSSLKQNLS